MDDKELISLDDLIAVVRQYKQLADKTAAESEYIKPVSVKVWQAGILLGMSDDMVRHQMLRHDQDASQGLDIGYVKTGKTGRHTYHIRDDKLSKELGISRLELRRVLAKYCKSSNRIDPRSLPIYKMATICGTTPQDLLQSQDLRSLIRIVEVDDRAIYYAISDKMIYHFILDSKNIKSMLY